MQTNKKRKNSIIFIILILIILIAITFLAKFAWARYMSSINGEAQADIAQWNFNVTAESRQDLIIDLAKTRYDNDTYSVDRATVAPGTSGEVILNINANVTDVSLRYDIDLDIGQIPQNLIFYSDSGMKNAIYHSDNNIHLEGFFNCNENNKTEQKVLYWKWPMETGQSEEQINSNDELDSDFMGRNITLGIQVIGSQVKEIPNLQDVEIALDLNGGILQWYGNSEKVIKISSYQVENIPKPTKEGYRFVGWNVGGENLIKEKMSAPGVWSTDISSVLLDKSILDGDTRTISGRSSSFESYLFYMPKVDLNSKHKYFCSVEAKSNILINNDSNTIDIYWPAIVEPPLTGYDGNKITQANTWTKISGVSNNKWAEAYSEYSGNYKVRYDFNNRYNEGTCTFRNPILIDLTETYGEGNEPNQEWCDNNIIYGETKAINISQDLQGKIVYFAVWEPINN